MPDFRLYRLIKNIKERGNMKVNFQKMMKTAMIGLLLSSVFLTGFTCSKNTPTANENGTSSEVSADQKESVPQEQMTTETSTTETSGASAPEENK